MRGITKALIALTVAGMPAGVGAIAILPMMMAAGSTSDPRTGDTAPVSCGTDVTKAGDATTLTDADQRGNAETIIRTGARMQVPTKGLIIAIATAMQESKLHNLHYGDRDSLGLFQQRAGWGSVAQREDPASSAGLFFRALLEVPGWQGMAVTEAAQAVQRSAFPTAYAQWEDLATTTVRQITGGTQPTCDDTPEAAGLPNGAVGRMLTTALAQQGDPYVWGAVGPDAFDCSGLVVYSWRQAGYRLTIRTAAQMRQNSTPIAAGSERPGDLLFSELAAPGGAGHVEIVVRRGEVVEAPHTGTVVHTRTYKVGPGDRLGRLHRDVMAQIPAG